jgi:hypothetical protein
MEKAIYNRSKALQTKTEIAPVSLRHKVILDFLKTREVDIWEFLYFLILLEPLTHIKKKTQLYMVYICYFITLVIFLNDFLSLQYKFFM